jgi:hypothetical protein
MTEGMVVNGDSAEGGTSNVAVSVRCSRKGSGGNAASPGGGSSIGDSLDIEGMAIDGDSSGGGTSTLEIVAGEMEISASLSSSSVKSGGSMPGTAEMTVSGETDAIAVGRTAVAAGLESTAMDSGNSSGASSSSSSSSST